MEDPISFDLWGIVKSGFTRDAIILLKSLQPMLSKLEAHKQINYSISNNVSILIARELSWNKVQEIKKQNSQIMNKAFVCQQEYTPEDFSINKYCQTHDLIYGGCLGCPVCTGFYK